MSQLSKKNNQIQTKKTLHNNSSNHPTSLSILFYFCVPLAIYPSSFKSWCQSFRWLHKTSKGFYRQWWWLSLSPFCFFLIISFLRYYLNIYLTYIPARLANQLAGMIALAIFDWLCCQSYRRNSNFDGSLHLFIVPINLSSHYHSVQQPETKPRIQERYAGYKKIEGVKEVCLSTSPHRTLRPQRKDPPAPPSTPRPACCIGGPACKLQPAPKQ